MEEISDLAKELKIPEEDRQKWVEEKYNKLKDERAERGVYEKDLKEKEVRLKEIQAQEEEILS